MHIKVDEDLPVQIVHRLRARGYDASGVAEQGMGGWKDPDVWHVVRDQRLFLVTGDKGFGDIRSYPPGTHAGVLLLRPDEDGIRPLVELLESVLTGYDLEALTGLLAVATPRGIRIRRVGA
jgi:predicted nuclease of predicted toxin-antitoxin system